MPECYIFMKNISFKYLTIALEAQNEREKFSESFEKEKWIIGQKSVHVFLINTV